MRRGSRRTQATTSYRDSWPHGLVALTRLRRPLSGAEYAAIETINTLQYAGGLLGRPGSGANHYHEIALSEIHDGLGFFIPDAKRPERADCSLDGEPENR
jgi:hypothetical protein